MNIQLLVIDPQNDFCHPDGSLFVPGADDDVERLAAFVESLKRALQAGSPLVVLSLGAVLVMNGSLTLGTMLALNALAVGFLTPLSTLVDNALQLQLLGSYIERIDDVLVLTSREEALLKRIGKTS